MLVWNATAGAWIELDSDGTGAVAFENRWGASFDGAGDHLSVPASTDFSFGTSDFSFSAWFNPEVISGYRSVVDFRPSDGDLLPGLFISPNAGYKLYIWAGSSRIVTYETTLNTNQWYHVVYTRSSGSATLYLNGSSVATGSDSNNYSLSGTPKWGGVGSGVGASTFKGLLDDCAIFNTALSTPDVAKIYNGTAPNGKPTSLKSASSYNTDRTSNLKGYWRMGDEDSASAGGSIATITDSSGNGNHATQGTASSQPTFKAHALSTTSLSFDGGNDYLSVSQNSSVNISGDITLSAWVNRTATTSYNAIYTKRQVGGSMNYQFIINNSSGQVGLGHSGGVWVYNTTTTLATGTWYHVAVTVSGSTAQFYVNGVPEDSFTGISINATAHDLIIGATAGYNYFVGDIDDAAIFNTALSASEVSSLAATRGAHIVNDLSLSPVAYLRMGEDDSLTDGQTGISQITDASGNGNHATQSTAANQPTARVNPLLYI
jgi:hypothetical protein